MNDRTYPYTPKNPRAKTGFKEKWGISAGELAAEEGTTTTAIHMRVMNYGTPFQRKRLPTICEVMTGKTAIQIALEENVTPFTISERLKNFGDAYCQGNNPLAVHTRGTSRTETHWSNTKQAGVTVGTKQGWLHPRHPEYHTWRYRYIQNHCPTAMDREAK